MFLPVFRTLTVFCNYLSEERSLEDRAVIFVVAVECSKNWSVNQPTLFYTATLPAVHLTYKKRLSHRWYYPKRKDSLTRFSKTMQFQEPSTFLKLLFDIPFRPAFIRDISFQVVYLAHLNYLIVNEKIHLQWVEANQRIKM